MSPPLFHRYVVLAPKGVEQATLLATTAADKKLGDLPSYQELLKKFTGKEVRSFQNRCCDGGTWSRGAGVR